MGTCEYIGCVYSCVYFMSIVVCSGTPSRRSLSLREGTCGQSPSRLFTLVRGEAGKAFIYERERCVRPPTSKEAYLSFVDLIFCHSLDERLTFRSSFNPDHHINLTGWWWWWWWWGVFCTQSEGRKVHSKEKNASVRLVFDKSPPYISGWCNRTCILHTQRCLSAVRTSSRVTRTRFICIIKELKTDE